MGVKACFVFLAFILFIVAFRLINIHFFNLLPLYVATENDRRVMYAFYLTRCQALLHLHHRVVEPFPIKKRSLSKFWTEKVLNAREDNTHAIGTWKKNTWNHSKRGPCYHVPRTLIVSPWTVKRKPTHVWAAHTTLPPPPSRRQPPRANGWEMRCCTSFHHAQTFSHLPFIFASFLLVLLKWCTLIMLNNFINPTSWNASF